MNLSIKKTAIIVSFIIAAAAASIYPLSAGEGAPAFYTGTDRSFGTNEKPYINLEGDGNREYSFRVYRVDGIEDFFAKTVKKRLVKETNDEAYGNAVAIFKDTFDFFKKDFRKVARAELNSATRTQTKKIAGVDLDTQFEPGDKALPSFLKNHTFLFSFSIPKNGSAWSYRRVPVPVKDNGVYLVEAVAGKNIGYSVIVKSNINFVTKLSDDETLVFAAKRDTGTPIDKADVKIFSEAGAVLKSGLTDSGIFSFKAKTPGKSLIVLRKGTEYAISDPDYYAKSFYGEGGFRSFIYTDRPVYRPGDTVYFKGIVRNFKDDNYAPVNGSGQVSVLNGENDTIVTNINAQVSRDMGTFDGSFILPKGSDVFLGTYVVVMSIGGKTFSTEFAVDAYKKPTYLVKVATQKKTYIGHEKIAATVSARYYYGSPVADESVRYRVFRKKKFDYSPVGSLPFFTEAAEYLGLGNTSTSDLVTQGDGRLDGRGVFEFTIEPDAVDDDYTYSIIADVTTADSTISGSSSVSVNRSAFFIRTTKDMAVFSPGDTVKMQADLIPFDSSLSEKDKAAAVSGKEVQVQLMTRSFTGISQEGERKVIESLERKTDSSGRAVFSFKLPEKGYYIISVKAEDEDGKETRTESSIWVSAKADSIEMPFKNITLKTSKDLYTAGEEAEVLIMTPAADGNIFITLEGNRILGREIVRLQGNTYRYKIKITPQMAPNFTLSAVQFSGNEVYKNQIKIISPPREKFLSVDVKPAQNEYKPGETAEIVIQTKDFRQKGVPAEVSVAVVDEAVYQIREEQNPSLATFFYHPRTNNVSTVFSSAYRFFGYSEEKRLQLALNAKQNPALAALKEEDAKSREKFKDTTYWSARVMTGEDGRAVIKVPLAENITTWRVTAMAVTPDTCVGQGKAQFIAKKHLMMNAGLPSYMIRGEKQTVIATVTNLTDKDIDAEVKAVVEGGRIIGKDSGKIKLEAGKNGSLNFTVVPSEHQDQKSCAVDLHVAGGGLSDGAKIRVPLKFFGRETVTPAVVRLENENDKKTVTINMPDTYAEARLDVRLSPGNGEALRQSLAYLADYPYGCIEQTMSRFMPLLAAKQAGYISPKLKDKLPRMVDEGVRLIKGHQKDDGGFGWYGEDGTDAMMSAYVYRGLVIAAKYNKSFDKTTAARTRYFLYSALDRGVRTPFEKAYIMFCLSEGEKLQKSMVDALVKETAREGLYVRTLTALVLFNQGEKDRAAAITNECLREYKKQNDPMKLFGEKDQWESDSVEATAALLTAAVRTNSSQADAEKLSANLVAMRNGLAWKNSRDTAFAVLALSEKIQKYRENGKPSAIKISVNGQDAVSVSVTPAEVDSGSTRINIPAGILKSGINEIRIEKNGGGAVFASVIAQYTDRSSALNPLNNGFKVERSYFKVEAETSDAGVDIKLNETGMFKTGDLVMAAIHITKKGNDGEYIMVEDSIPPGFSAVKQDGEYYSNSNAKEYSQRQMYDDRAVFFIKGPSGEAVIRYFLRADIPGSIKALPASASMMYYPEINGSSADTQLTVGE